MNERCFALQKNGVCRAVTGNCPGHHGCGFYKPKWKYDKDRRMAYRRLDALPPAQQRKIAEKYYGGTMPWGSWEI